MTPEIHARNRAWTFEALDRIQAFLDDPDFENASDEERVQLERARERLRGAKYRVVFLGAFNVGKSTLINAYLGDEYLPRILQECTTKITHVVRGDRLQVVLPLSSEATSEEVQALRAFLESSGAQAEVERDGRNLAIGFADSAPGDLRNALNALITMTAPEDFPRLQSLREKFEEVEAVLPNDRLPEDVDFVDSPGVHSIGETRPAMTEEILPGTHVVVYLLDSQSAGNEQSREFIQNLVRHGKKIFFVLNKADQLNPDEIDPQGHCGPARDLLRSIAGIVEDPEVFFVSSLYALLAQQLQEGRIGIEDLDRNNKVKIPMALQRRILSEENAVEAIADYLMAESRYRPFEKRLLEYLFAENEEGAAVYATARLLADKAWRYSRPLESRLDMARNVPRLFELRRERERLTGILEGNRATLADAMAEYEVLADGGEQGGSVYEGYAPLVDRRLSEEAVETEVVRPVREWLDNGDSFRQARKARFRPVESDVEQRFEDLLERVTADLNREIDGAEARIRARVAGVLPDAEGLRSRPIDVPHAGLGRLRAGLGKSYLGFGIIGAIVGAAAGAAVGSFVDIAWPPQMEELVSAYLPVAEPDGAVLAIVGAVLGFLVGLVARASGSDDARRERIDAWLKRQADQAIRTEAREQLLRNAERRRREFAQMVEQAFAVIDGDLESRIATLRAEEEELERTQHEIVQRLEPKVSELQDLGRKARSVAENRRLPDEGTVPVPVE